MIIIITQNNQSTLKKLIIIFSLVILFSNSYGQKTVMIDFYEKSTGDYDLMLQNILNQNGYDAIVNYGNNMKETDYVLKYVTTSRSGYDELHEYSLTLLDSSRNIINSVEKTISYINFGIIEPKELCKGLNKLLKKRFLCRNCTEETEVKYFNISFNVHKIDSCTYSIIAKGAGIRPLKDVEKAFLIKAGQYLSSFDYYFESGKYNYTATNGQIVTSHSGYKVMGIIKGSTNDNDIKNVINEKPTEFIYEFED
jgi:hypothetical protein